MINRVKPRVAFRGRFESGLGKRVAIGLGKQQGAATGHDLGFGCMAENILAMARVTLSTATVVGAVGVAENAYGDIRHVGVMPGHAIEAEEPALLELARSLTPRLHFDERDVLMADEIGEDVAGTGFDTNTIGLPFDHTGALARPR